MKKIRRKKPGGNETEVILLRDLAPPGDVKGGAGKIVFGERLEDGAGAAAGLGSHGASTTAGSDRLDRRSAERRPRRKS